jgi:HK97 family phage prohead protease
MPTRDFDLKVKQLSESGVFTGLASTYGNVDLGGDVIESGAFVRTLQQRGAEVPILWSHDQSNPVGIGTLTDTAAGLEIRGSLDMDIQSGRDAYSRLKKKIVRGLSIGFRSVQDVVKDGIRHLTDVDLFEVSLVAVPMNEAARVTSVKAAELASIRDFERFLHESGFSKSKAAAIASKGWKVGIEAPDTDPDAELRAWLELQLSRV